MEIRRVFIHSQGFQARSSSFEFSRSEKFVIFERETRNKTQLLPQMNLFMLVALPVVSADTRGWATATTKNVRHNLHHRF